MTYTCPVCAYSGLQEPPIPYTVCVSCGTEFGVDDFGMTRDLHASVPPAPGSAPVGLATGMRWDILVLWSREPGDEDKTFHQRCELFTPDGQATGLKADFEFRMETQWHRTIASIMGFPVGPAGTYHIKLWLTEVGHDPVEVGIYPIRLMTQEKARQL